MGSVQSTRLVISPPDRYSVNDSGHSRTRGGNGSLTRIVIRHESDTDEWGLRARNVTSWRPSGTSPSRCFAHGGSASTNLNPGFPDGKIDPFLSLDCARAEGMGAQSKDRRGSHFAVQGSGAIVQKPDGPSTYDSKNPAIAIWQPCVSYVMLLKVRLPTTS